MLFCDYPKFPLLCFSVSHLLSPIADYPLPGARYLEVDFGEMAGFNCNLRPLV